MPSGATGTTLRDGAAPSSRAGRILPLRLRGTKADSLLNKLSLLLPPALARLPATPAHLGCETEAAPDPPGSIATARL